MLAACRRAAEAAGIDYPQLVYPRIQKEVSLASLIPIRVMCRWTGVSRAGFYRWQHVSPLSPAGRGKSPQEMGDGDAAPTAAYFTGKKLLSAFNSLS
jgi:hypothetical protein